MACASLDEDFRSKFVCKFSDYMLFDNMRWRYRPSLSLPFFHLFYLMLSDFASLYASYQGRIYRCEFNKLF